MVVLKSSSASITQASVVSILLPLLPYLTHYTTLFWALLWYCWVLVYYCQTFFKYGSLKLAFTTKHKEQNFLWFLVFLKKIGNTKWYFSPLRYLDVPDTFSCLFCCLEFQMLFLRTFSVLWPCVDTLTSRIELIWTHLCFHFKIISKSLESSYEIKLNPWARNLVINNNGKVSKIKLKYFTVNFINTCICYF